MYFILFRAVASCTVDCALVRSETRLNFTWDLVSLRTKTCQGEEQMRRLFSCHRGSHSQLLKEQTSTSQSQYGNRGLSNIHSTNKSGAPPGTTCTRSTPLTPAIPTRSMAIVLVSSVSSLLKRKVMALSSLIFCVLTPPLFCEHLFPFLQSFWSIKKREQLVSITPCPM